MPFEIKFITTVGELFILKVRKAGVWAFALN